MLFDNMIENEEKILSDRKRNALKETFGSFRFKRPIEDILDEGDKESWNE